ncbi:hypothetical protein B0H15DRAFT_579947 [Mycena belliarum]|uniref:Haemolytic enterotoxin (HBL) n=1 Tax=Mycena belliarum TaxID=1033014 RepID=A0AAD6UH11_9AGAR|nr:hypothetical protein B0H15DRAFT_579947 [Mycena belliae]
MSFPTPDLAPNGLVNTKGDYILHNPDIFNLLTRLWTGILLPQNAEDYRAHTGISIGTYNKYKTLLEPLIADHKVIASHCTHYKETTFMNIVGLADEVRNYAHLASGGGNLAASYYHVIFDTIGKLAACTSADPPNKAATLKAGIAAGVDAMITKIDVFNSAAAGVKSDLDTFAGQCEEDASKLEAHISSITEVVDTVESDIEDLQKQIKQDMRDLSDAGVELAHDQTIFYTAAAFGWITEIGTSVLAAALPEAAPVADAAGHVASEITDTITTEYGDKVKALSKSIEDLQAKLRSEDQKLQEEVAIVAQLSNAKLDIDASAPLVKRVADSIVAIIGAWNTIKGELVALKSTADKDIGSLAAAYTPAVTESVIKQWDNLETAVEAYRLGAYVSALPTITTLDEYSEALAAKVGASQV